MKIKYWFLLGFCKFIGLLPTRFIYHPLLEIEYFILYKVFRYRLSTVRKNLSESFPEKNKTELLLIEKGFYRHLSEVILDTIYLVSIKREELDSRMEFINIENHEAEVAGKNWIAALAHYGSWEYFSAYQLHTCSQVVGVYRPLHDKAADKLYRYSRSRFGLKPVAMKNILRYVFENKDNAQEKIALGLIADQNAPRKEKAIWFDFLNHKTLFFSGIEKLAVKFGMPVYYMDVIKIERTKYRAEMVMIYDGKEELPEGGITGRYVERLEHTIRRDPRFWMWSHRRWKYLYKEPDEVATSNLIKDKNTTNNQ